MLEYVYACKDIANNNEIIPIINKMSSDDRFRCNIYCLDNPLTKTNKFHFPLYYNIR